MFSVNEILDLGIRIEENGELFYRQALENASDPSLRALLEWLADEELTHGDWFLEMKRSAKGLRGNDLWAEQVGGAILQSSLKDRAFSLDEVEPGSIRDEETLILMAIEFEQDSITFYEILQSFITEPEVLDHIRVIINEERRHIELLEERQKRR